MTVLIVDDSPVIVERLIEAVGKIRGIERLDQADTVATASEAVRRLRPDVVILDMQMPGGSGLDVLKIIKEDGIGCAVIVLTNFAYPQYRRKCFKAAPSFFWISPRNLRRSANCCIVSVLVLPVGPDRTNHSADEVQECTNR